MEVEDGEAEPPPWYFPYFTAAETCQCAPWELVDKPTPRRFWLHAAVMVNEARARARLAQKDKDEKG